MTRRHWLLAPVLALALTSCDAAISNGGRSLSASDTALLDSVRYTTGIARDDMISDLDSIVVTEQDLPDKLYQVLGDVRVRIYPEGPGKTLTRERTKLYLQKEAALLGADAVIHVRYGNRTPFFLRGASIDATGTAVRLWRSAERVDREGEGEPLDGKVFPRGVK